MNENGYHLTFMFDPYPWWFFSMRLPRRTSTSKVPWPWPELQRPGHLKLGAPGLGTSVNKTEHTNRFWGTETFFEYQPPHTSTKRLLAMTLPGLLYTPYSFKVYEWDNIIIPAQNSDSKWRRWEWWETKDVLRKLICLEGYTLIPTKLNTSPISLPARSCIAPTQTLPSQPWKLAWGLHSSPTKCGQ